MRAPIQSGQGDKCCDNTRRFHGLRIANSSTLSRLKLAVFNNAALLETDHLAELGWQLDGKRANHRSAYAQLRADSWPFGQSSDLDRAQSGPRARTDPYMVGYSRGNS
jgi:hypothetical protein